MDFSHTPLNHKKEDDKSSSIDLAMFDTEDEKSSSVDLKMFRTEDSNASDLDDCCHHIKKVQEDSGGGQEQGEQRFSNIKFIYY
jgi:hypothetical protein